MQICRNRVRAFRTKLSLRPPTFGAIRPAMDFANLADRSGPNDFAQLAIAYARMTLVTHLRRDFVFTRGKGESASFINGVRKRFLAINVFAHRNGEHRSGRVMMIGRAYSDGIEFLFFVEHDAVI